MSIPAMLKVAVLPAAWRCSSLPGVPADEGPPVAALDYLL
jgi:hypothetical protein